MKKSLNLFLVLVLLVGILFASGVSAESAGEQLESNIEGLGEKIDGVENAIENPMQTKNWLLNEYLAREWQKILNNTAVGKSLLEVHWFLKENREIFGLFLGIDYEISWKFFLAVFFWFFLVFLFSGWISGLSIAVVIFIIYLLTSSKGKHKRYDGVYKFLRNYKKYGMGLLKVFIFFLVVFILSAVRLPLGLSTLINGIFSSETDFFKKVIYVVIGILIIVILRFVGKFFRRYYKSFISAIKEIELESLVDRVDEAREKKTDRENSSEEAGLTESQAFAKGYLESFGEELRKLK